MQNFQSFKPFTNLVSPSQSPASRLPPSRLKEATVIEDSYPVSSARWASSSQHQTHPRTATILTVGPRQEFAPLDASNITFCIATPQSLSQPSTPISPNDGDRRSQTSRGESREPVAKKPRLDHNSGKWITSKKLSLNTNRPVKNAKDVHLDAWRLILSCSDLKFLLEARTICRSFYQILQDQSIWKICREGQYGPDLPAPPGHMTEQKYADLIVGKGCQSRSCPKTNTAKVYWAFQVRLCSDCLRLRTMKDDSISGHDVQMIGDRNLLDLIPTAKTRCGKYQRSRQPNTLDNEWPGRTHIMFLKRDYERIQAKYHEYLQDDEKRRLIADWASKVQTEIEKLMDAMSKIELWEKDRAIIILDHRSDREVFFAARAAELCPPMSREVLLMMSAYHNAVAVNTPPSDKAWELLRAKITPYRAQAEALVKVKLFGGYVVPGSASAADMDLFRRLHLHRGARRYIPENVQPEQKFVLNLGRKALSKCRERAVADSDLLLVCLQTVFDDYERIPISERPNGLNADGVDGSYLLTIDDARMIVENLIESEVGRHSRRGAVVLSELKCIGCPRKDCTKRYSFTSGFEHILAKHAGQVGEGLHFNQFLKKFPRYVDTCFFHFPWYTIPWPRCLPLVPSHHIVDRTTRWDPNGSITYTASKMGGVVSAFEGLMAYDNPQIPTEDFAGNFVFAAKLFKNTAVGSECQTKVALKYALERYAILSWDMPPLQALKSSFAKVQEINATFDCRFRCGACSQDEHIHRNTKFVKYPVAFSILQKHWEKKHEEVEWPANLMKLPSDTEVRDQLLQADATLRQDQEELRAREESRQHNAKIRVNVKAPVVLNMDFAMDAFEKLFVRA